ncbi:sulfurtransferase TusA family protein [Vibrio casei]|uniref:sulfurtransferase TusA family protein n=1 Tax=Vibrio casei TaxID=673372 RepID=UPI003F981DFA
MKATPLDLRSQRCPMALLLAKRQCAQLSNQETLTILSTDKASINDMVRYFNQSPFSVEVLIQSECSTLLVTKKESF